MVPANAGAYHPSALAAVRRNYAAYALAGTGTESSAVDLPDLCARRLSFDPRCRGGGAGLGRKFQCIARTRATATERRSPTKRPQAGAFATSPKSIFTFSILPVKANGSL